MYEFIDVTATQGGTSIPSEAMKINGEYIENQIVGYQTLYVQGREALAPDLDTFETGIRDGSSIRSKRFPARTITVGYQLVAATNEAFRSAFNKLNSILNVQDAQLIFADEQDKYFRGTPTGYGKVETGRNAVTAEFEIFCADPFKYSVAEYEASLIDIETGKAFSVDYNGTYKAYPTFEADFATEVEASGTTLAAKGDCGYVAFLSADQKVIQIGDSEEKDSATYPESQTLINQDLVSWDSAMQSQWAANKTPIFPTIANTGSVHIGLDEWGNRMICGGEYGSGSNYHGPSIARAVPADASGHVGAVNCRMTWKQRLAMSLNANTQCGEFRAMLVNYDSTTGVRKLVAGISVLKNNSTSKAWYYYYVNSDTSGALAVKQTNGYDVTRNGSRFGYKTGVAVLYSTIQKSGGTITFNIGGVKSSFTDAALENVEVNEIAFSFGQYGSRPVFKSNGVFNVKFIKDNCDGFQDIPNKFSSNDVAKVDCSNGEITLNDSPAPELGALGNDWEEFALVPGSNLIGATWSDWVNTAPTVKMRYRERYL